MLIFVKLFSGKTITCDVWAGNTISLVKQKINKKTGLKPSQHQLLYSGNSLEDDQTIADYDIPKEATLVLLESTPTVEMAIPSDVRVPFPITPPVSIPKIHLTVRISRTEQQLFEVHLNDMIQPFVESLALRIGVAPGKRIALYAGQHKLEHWNTFAEEGLKDNDVLHLTTIAMNGMPVFVKLFSGQVVTFNVQLTDTIASLKQKIKEKERINPSEQILKYNECILEDGQTVGGYDIPKEATINLINSVSLSHSDISAYSSPPLVQSHPEPPCKIQVTVRDSSNRCLCFQVNPNDQAQVLIDLVAKTINISSKKFALYYGQHKVDPKQTFVEQGINNHCPFMCVAQCKGC